MRSEVQGWNWILYDHWKNPGRQDMSFSVLPVYSHWWISIGVPSMNSSSVLQSLLLDFPIAWRAAELQRSTFLPKVVQMCWNSTKWWFFAKIVVGMTSFPIVGVSDFTSLSCSPTITTLGSEVCPNYGQGSPIPTRKLEICWSPTIFPNNGKGRCTGTAYLQGFLSHRKRH